MPVYQSLLDNDRLFQELKRAPVIVNDLQNSTSKDREHIERLIMTTYSGDMVSVMPSCRCGVTKGEFSRNTVCESCGTSVSSTIEDTIEPLIWFRRPHGVEKLISPIVWIMLNDRFTKSKFSIIRWLTDTTYAPGIKKPPALAKIEEANIPRGYNHFIQNFFEIISFLLTIKDFRLKNGEHDYLAELLEQQRHNLFSDHIPLINKSLLIIEKTSMATYVDNMVPLALDAIEMLVSIDRDFYDQTGAAKENRTARAMHSLSEFFREYFRTIVDGKPGIFRHYVGGSRFDFSARAVIASITDEHRHDEITIPWGIGLTIFRPMLMNKLMNRDGMLPNDAVSLLIGHTGIYHPLLDQYLQEIIASTREGRYPVLINRFPSLLQGSIQRVFVRKVKTDPDDKTIQLSILITTAPNADFDGDMMCIYPSLDHAMADMWYALAPKFNVFGMSEPLKITDNVKLPKPVVVTIGSWLAEEEV